MNQLEKKDGKKAVIKTNRGDMTFVLLDEAAPKAVENFTTHAKNGYYNSLIFHRVINDFMIQGGDPKGTGRGGESIWGDSFEDEFDLELRNYRGALSMANAGPNTNGSQFFIVQTSQLREGQKESMKNNGVDKQAIAKYEAEGGTPWLDGQHTVFGQVIEGMEVVDAIAAVATDENDRPLEEVSILSVTVETYTAQ